MFLLAGPISTFYLIRNRVYVIGNSSADISIEHPSISSNHAEITIRHEDAFIRSTSKAPTKVDGIKLPHKEQHRLKKEHKIQFGEVIFLLKYENRAVTCTTGLTKESKKKVDEIVKKIDGVFYEQWTDECTHLTTNEIVVTCKLLHALIDNKPIVTLEYWNEYLECIKKNRPLPDPAKFYPPFGENAVNVRFTKYSPERVKVFEKKIFVCFEKNKILKVIEKTGGKCVLVDENVSKNKLSKMMHDFIVLEPEKLTVREKYSDFIKLYLETDRRLIPVHEVALAILQSSCQEHCNPSFNKIETVFKHEDDITIDYQIIIPETEYNSELQLETCADQLMPDSQIEDSHFEEELRKPVPESLCEFPEPEKCAEPSPKRIKLDVSSSVSESVQTQDQQVQSKKRKHLSETRRLFINDVLFDEIPSKKFKENIPSLKRNPFRLAQKEIIHSTEITNENHKFNESNQFILTPKSDNSSYSTARPSTSGLMDGSKSVRKINPFVLSPTKTSIASLSQRDISKDAQKNKGKFSKKIFVEDMPDFSTLEHNVTQGKIFCALKKEEQNDKMNEENSEWLKQFQNSFSISSSHRGNVTNSTKNFKKFRKVPIIKSGVIIKCSI